MKKYNLSVILTLVYLAELANPVVTYMFTK